MISSMFEQLCEWLSSPVMAFVYFLIVLPVSLCLAPKGSLDSATNVQFDFKAFRLQQFDLQTIPLGLFIVLINILFRPSVRIQSVFYYYVVNEKNYAGILSCYGFVSRFIWGILKIRLVFRKPFIRRAL